MISAISVITSCSRPSAPLHLTIQTLQSNTDVCGLITGITQTTPGKISYSIYCHFDNRYLP